MCLLFCRKNVTDILSNPILRGKKGFCDGWGRGRGRINTDLWTERDRMSRGRALAPPSTAGLTSPEGAGCVQT